jgi:hypothetical protein
MLQRDYKGVDEDVAVGVDEDVDEHIGDEEQPMEEMVTGVGMAPLVEGGAQGGGRCPRGQLPLGRPSSLAMVLILRSFSPLWWLPRRRIFVAMVGFSKSWVSPQYIEVEMQFWPYDGCPLIQGLLGTS